MSSPSAIADVLHNLEHVVPDEHKGKFIHLRSKIEYTAPEIVGMRWNETYELLMRITPQEGTAPEWVQQASEIWNRANREQATSAARA